MADAPFVKIHEDGRLVLFRWTGTSGACHIYGLILQDDIRAHESKLSLQALWQGEAPSAILISAFELDDDLAANNGQLDSLAHYIGFPRPQHGDNVIAWLDDLPGNLPPERYKDYKTLIINRHNDELDGQSGFNLGVLLVSVLDSQVGQATARWHWPSASLVLSENAYFFAKRLDNLASQERWAAHPGSQIGMSLIGNLAGAFMLQMTEDGGPDPSNLFALLGDQPPPAVFYPRGGPECRYFHPAGKLSYPIIKPVRAVGKKLSLRLSLNAAHPFNPIQTRFEPNIGEEWIHDLFVCETVIQSNGQPAKLTPNTGFSFHLAKTPDTHNGWSKFYPAPMGSMSVDSTETINLMCGLSGLEFLQVSAGDKVNFIPAQPAYSSAFDPESHKDRSAAPEKAPSPDQILTSHGQTSWLALENKSSYFAQADVEPFFSSAVIPDASYPTAVSSRLSQPNNINGKSVAFPFAPYAGVYDESGANKHLSSEVFSAYESQVIVQHRHSVLVPVDTNPVFGDLDGNALSGGNAATPTGFIAELNTHADDSRFQGGLGASEATSISPSVGTWKSLTLARHYENKKDQTLAFLANENGTIYPPLIQGMLHSKVFLVANNWDALGDMQSELLVDGFAFHVKPVNKEDAHNTIAIFKLQTTASLLQMINKPDAWFRPDEFIVGSTEVVINGIKNAIDVANSAKGTPSDPFEHFRDTIIHDPNWSGVVFFHVPINGNDMPADLKILFAGINGELYAHHFGIDLNHIKIAEDRQPKLEQSSLFGVIRYQGTPPAPTNAEDAPFTFTVLDLTVAIVNTMVTDFDAIVALEIPHLFERSVSFIDHAGLDQVKKLFPSRVKELDKLNNALILQGVYQKQGDVGTVSFQRKQPVAIMATKEPNLARVVDEYYVSSATLAPTASPPLHHPTDDKNQLVHGRFSLGGQLCFSANPFGVDDPADLFSFGQAGKAASASNDADGEDAPPVPMAGLKLAELGLNVSFYLNKAGARSHPTVIDADYSRVQVNQNKQGIRENSLLASFPLKVTSLVHETGALTPHKLAASPVNVVNIKGHDGGTASFALEFDLPLGSLGFLAGAHADLSSKLILSWGNGLGTPDNDSVQVLVRLFNVSANVQGFDLEGIVKVGFKDANMIRVENERLGEDVYVALFNNVGITILGIAFPPNVLANFLLMAGPGEPGEDTSHKNIAWAMSAAQAGDG